MVEEVVRQVWVVEAVCQGLKERGGGKVRAGHQERMGLEEALLVMDN